MYEAIQTRTSIRRNHIRYYLGERVNGKGYSV